MMMTDDGYLDVNAFADELLGRINEGKCRLSIPNSNNGDDATSNDSSAAATTATAAGAGHDDNGDDNGDDNYQNDGNSIDNESEVVDYNKYSNNHLPTVVKMNNNINSNINSNNVQYDFGAWNTFRRSLSFETQVVLKQSLANNRELSFGLASFSEGDEEDDDSVIMSHDDDDDDDDSFFYEMPLSTTSESAAVAVAEEERDTTADTTTTAANKNESCDDSPATTTAPTVPTMNYLPLSDSERFDNEAWRMRLEVDEVFSVKYVPKKWERQEMDAIIQFLALKNPSHHPEYLNKPQQQRTKEAISSIFFPNQGHHNRNNEQQQQQQQQVILSSVLLKRGPVLLAGEERELLLFSGGFVSLSCVELDTLVNLLLDASSGRVRRLSTKELSERFSVIDSDGSGSLDRSEIRDFFHTMEMSPSETVLDGLMSKFSSSSPSPSSSSSTSVTPDSNEGEVLSFEDFKSMMDEIGNKLDDKKNGCSFWKGLRGKLKRALANHGGVTRRLDVAFRMTDVERIENLACRMMSTTTGDIGGNGGNNVKEKTRSTMLVDANPELAPLTFAIYLRHTDIPLVITCSKPGHVDAWVHAFRTCVTWQLPTVDWGAGDVRRNGNGGGLSDHDVFSDEWRCSTIDWGDDDDDEDEGDENGGRGVSANPDACSTIDWG